MKSITSCFVGFGLLVALSGCSAATHASPEPAASTSAVGDSGNGSGATDVVEVDTEQVLPADSSALAEDGFWERNQAPLGTATAAIEEQFPDEFAYAFFDDSSAMHVAFAGPAPAEAVVLLQNTGLPFVIVESVGFNAAEYDAALDAVVEQTLQYVTPEREVTVSSDPSAGRGAIKVSFQSNDPELTTDPGLATPPVGSRFQPVSVDAPFIMTFDNTKTSPSAPNG